MPDARAVLLDPREPAVWRHDGPWWAPLTRRPYVAAVLLAAGAVLTTILVALHEDLPIRDADGVLGSRMWLLLGVLGTFLALEVLPRAWSLRRAAGVPYADAVRDVMAERWSGRRLRIVVLGLVSFYATYIAYRNLKSFLPFVVQQDLDGSLLSFERGIFGDDPATMLHSLLGTGVSAHVLSTVYLAYLGFVPVSLGAAFILAVNPVPGLWWVTALGLNWMLGAASYYVLPALGPAYAAPELFTALPHTDTSALQLSLLVHRFEVLAAPHLTPQVQSIAAFASLHVSVVFSAALMAQLLRLHAALRWALWGFLGLTLLATIYFGWHYVVDDIAGLVIGAVAVGVGAVATGHLSPLRGRTT
jgi:hypothetical protein